MSEKYTPTTDDVRDALSEWMWHSRTWRPGLIGADTNEAFDRFLAQVRREAKVDALREMVKELHPGAVHESRYVKAGLDIIRIIEETADQLEQEGKNDE